MISENKIKKIKEIKEKENWAKTIIFYNFQGLPNEYVFRLKNDLKELGGIWKVYKNTLVKRALLTYFNDTPIKYNNALIFCENNENKIINMLMDFNKDNDNIKRIQLGIYDKKLVDYIYLEKIASLPSKDIIFSSLFFLLKKNMIILIEILENLNKKLKQ